MTSARDVAAQQGPPEDLRAFPVHRMTAATRLYRAHQGDRSPWWFASGGGRFDLPAPHGTCYLATSALVAVRERLGPVLARRASVPASTVQGVVVSRLTPGRPGATTVRLANIRVAAAADFGVTRELESMTPYDVPVQWAQGFAEIGLEGVRYGPRFSPGVASAVGLFGSAGQDDQRRTDPEPVRLPDVPGAPDVVDLPRRSELTVISAPRTAGSRMGPRPPERT